MFRCIPWSDANKTVVITCKDADGNIVDPEDDSCRTIMQEENSISQKPKVELVRCLSLSLSLSLEKRLAPRPAPPGQTRRGRGTLVTGTSLCNVTSVCGSGHED
eukprot:COSAG01_NODE_2192_length_8185_cov_66.560846_3_plen_104_part_00